MYERKIMPDFRKYRNAWREKNHNQFSYLQKCIEEKKSGPISRTTVMYEEKIRPDFRINRNVWKESHATYTGDKNHANFHVYKN